MKKVLVVIFIFLAVAAGYLYYDWDTQTKKAASEPDKILYSWTDEKGVKHFTDKEPPAGAKNIEKTTGFKYVRPPLVTTIKNNAVNFYRWAKSKLSGVGKNPFKRKSKQPSED